jgi:hypothetical protein
MVLPEGADTRLAFAAARSAGAQIRRIEIRRDSLETAFLRVIGEASPPSATPGAFTPSGGAS